MQMPGGFVPQPGYAPNYPMPQGAGQFNPGMGQLPQPFVGR